MNYDDHMRKPICVILAVFVFSALMSAQNAENYPCPQISVDGPSGFVERGRLAIFSAHFRGIDKRLKLRYKWSVSTGEIVSGQGTKTIAVRQPDEPIAVTFDVIGLSAGCAHLASETEIVDRGPQPIRLDSFSGPVSQINPARFDRIKEILRQNRSSQLLIYLSHSKQHQSVDIEAWRKGVFHDLTSPKEDYRITFVEIEMADDDRAEIWLIPPGADARPVCGICKDVKIRNR